MQEEGLTCRCRLAVLEQKDQASGLAIVVAAEVEEDVVWVMVLVGGHQWYRTLLYPCRPD